jgi:hypothetical protein
MQVQFIGEVVEVLKLFFCKATGGGSYIHKPYIEQGRLDISTPTLTSSIIISYLHGNFSMIPIIAAFSFLGASLILGLGG